MQTLTAISIRQPWASAILLGKDVENRSRCYRHRGPLLIHASLKLDADAMRDPRILALPKTDFIVGHLLGVVTVLDCVRDSRSLWADQDSWKLVLSNPRPLLRPVPYRGQLALFQVPLTLLKDVLPLGLELSPAQGSFSL